VDQLLLDGIFKDNYRILPEEFKEGLEKYTKLRHLSLSGLGLACLDRLP